MPITTNDIEQSGITESPKVGTIGVYPIVALSPKIWHNIYYYERYTNYGNWF